MRWQTTGALCLLAALICSLGSVGLSVHAQTALPQGATPSSPDAAASPPPPDRIARLEQQVAEARSSGDNAWMLVSSALGLVMTGPGLALFYGGLVRKKHVLATMMQSFALLLLLPVLWPLVGYSLCLHSGNSFLGRLGYFGL